MLTTTVEVDGPNISSREGVPMRIPDYGGCGPVYWETADLSDRRSKCTYADRYQAKRRPTCGCVACENKWLGLDPYYPDPEGGR